MIKFFQDRTYKKCLAAIFSAWASLPSWNKTKDYD